MKSKLLILIAVLMLGINGLVWAEDGAEATAEGMKMDDMKAEEMPMGEMKEDAMKADEPMGDMMEGSETKPADDAEVGNKICPISGEKIVMDKKGTVEYKGKTYNLCCSMCKKDFEKDPEKYIQKLKDMEASGEVAAEEAEPEHQEMK